MVSLLNWLSLFLFLMTLNDIIFQADPVVVSERPFLGTVIVKSLPIAEVTYMGEQF